MDDTHALLTTDQLYEDQPSEKHVNTIKNKIVNWFFIGFGAGAIAAIIACLTIDAIMFISTRDAEVQERTELQQYIEEILKDEPNRMQPGEIHKNPNRFFKTLDMDEVVTIEDAKVNEIGYNWIRIDYVPIMLYIDPVTADSYNVGAKYILQGKVMENPSEWDDYSIALYGVTALFQY